MRSAFKHYLVVETAHVLQFIRETGGSAAVRRIRAAGNNRFAITAFRKLDCHRSHKKAGYICRFKADIKLVTGTMRRTLEGRFYKTSAGIRFEFIEQPVRPMLATT